MADFSGLALLNKCANLLCLVLFGIYLVRSYLIPYIEKALKVRSDILLAQDQQACNLAEKHASLEKEIQDHQAYRQVLLHKITSWKDNINLRKEIKKQEDDCTKKKSQEYLKKRADGLCQDLLQRHIFSKVIEDSRKRVIDFFNKKQEQQKYMQTIFKDLKKGTHE